MHSIWRLQSRANCLLLLPSAGCGHFLIFLITKLQFPAQWSHCLLLFSSQLGFPLPSSHKGMSLDLQPLQKSQNYFLISRFTIIIVRHFLRREYNAWGKNTEMYLWGLVDTAFNLLLDAVQSMFRCTVSHTESDNILNPSLHLPSVWQCVYIHHPSLALPSV